MHLDILEHLNRATASQVSWRRVFKRTGGILEEQLIVLYFRVEKVHLNPKFNQKLKQLVAKYTTNRIRRESD